MLDGSISGFTDPRFDAVAETFKVNLDSGADVGASFCATVEGEIVVDLWGGFADEAKARPWERDTIVNVYSTTKTMAALCALVLADRGELDFNAPVAEYWPEFAANGKGEIKVTHLMSHSAGLSGWAEPISTTDLYDWDKACGLLAAQAPFWEPGTAPGYHGLTQGYLVGEVVRRITGRSLGTFFRQEVAEPLEADFWIGLPAGEDHRVAELIAPPPGGGVGDGAMSELMRNMATNPGLDPLDTRTRQWRGAEIPAAGGTGNARSVALIQAVLANGGVAEGKRLLSGAGCRKALQAQVEGLDKVMGIPARFGLGFGLAGGPLPLPNPNCMYWGGYGGSLIIIDMEARASFAFVMNKMAPTTTGDMRGFGLAMGMWQALSV